MRAAASSLYLAACKLPSFWPAGNISQRIMLAQQSRKLALLRWLQLALASVTARSPYRWRRQYRYSGENIGISAQRSLAGSKLALPGRSACTGVPAWRSGEMPSAQLGAAYHQLQRVPLALARLALSAWRR
jgi:hypothetical protein